MRRSFAFRLALTFAAVGIVTAIITALLVNLAFGNRFERYLAEQREGRQTELARSLEESYDRMRGWDASDLRNLSALALSDGGEVRLMDARGNVVWEPTATPEGRAMAELHRKMLGGGALGPEQHLPLVVDGERVGSLGVRLPAPSLNPEDVAFRSSINRLLIIGGFIAGILALALGIVLARRTLGPARRMTEAAQALASGDRSHRVAIDTTAELGAMGEAFNKMADTIEEEDELRRLFASDVAHELRTPLAILRTQIEAIQDGVSQPTPEVVASLHEETLRLTRLVADLETLASAEAAHFSMKPSDLDMRPLMEAVAVEFAGPYDAKGVSLETDLRPASAYADPTRMHQIASNLLSNALKFTEPGGRVRLSLRAEDSWAILEVEDTGSGISPEEFDHVFDRFYRGKDVRAGGSGIGLTVVRELVEAHGGRIQLASDASGTRFTLSIPGASPSMQGDAAAPTGPTATDQSSPDASSLR